MARVTFSTYTDAHVDIVMLSATLVVVPPELLYRVIPITKNIPNAS